MIISRHTSLIAVFLLCLVLPTATVAQQPLPAEGDESQLLAVIESDAELFDKAKACQRLAVIGTSESVPVLAKLLAVPELSHYARTALEANPVADVDVAFREALADLKGRQLVGVINSIAVRRDAEATESLVRLASDDDDEIAGAAMSALGSLATTESVAAVQQMLSGESSRRVTAADACLTAADRLIIEGKNDRALEILKAVRSAELPKHLNVAARFGEIRSGTQSPNELMNAYLSDADPSLFRIGLELAHDLTDAETTSQLLKHLDSLSPERQVLLMHVLGERGETSAIGKVFDAAKSDDAKLRLAAIGVLGTLGDRTAVPVLLKAAASEDEQLAATAKESLVALDDQDVDAELAKQLEDSKGTERLVLVDVVGRRGISRVIPLLLQYASSSDPDLRNSAIDGLGMTVGLENFPELVDQMLAMGASPSAVPMKEALRKASQRIGNREAAAKVLLDRCSDASAAAQVELMDLLVYVGGDAALEGVKTAALGDDAASADAATQALGRWLTPDAAPVLLELAQSGNPNYQVRCLRGYIRIIRQFGLREGQRLQMSKEAFAAATRDEERKLVLDTLTRFPSPQALRFTTPHLDNPTLREDASRAAVTISEKIVEKDPKLVANTMTKVVAVTDNDEIAKRANVLIARTNSQ